jgi:uncharacterized RDD family membrane protein YckC
MSRHAEDIIMVEHEPHVPEESPEAPTPSVESGAAPLIPSPSPSKRCHFCGQPASRSAIYCPECGTRIDPYPDPAGFWIRVVATSIDSCLVHLPLRFLTFLALSIHSLPLAIVVSIPKFIYKPFMESYYGATLGKMACGITVVDGLGEKLTLRAAYLRFLPFLLTGVASWLGIFWIVSVPDSEFMKVSGFQEISDFMERHPFDPLHNFMLFILTVDCVTAAFARRNRALHDMIAGSFCIRKAR